jgi:hypothetical protein
MRLLARISILAVVSLIAVLVVLSNQTRKETRSNKAESDVAQKEQDQAVEAQATPTVVDDDPGAKPNAQDPATKINQVVTLLKSDPRYRFLKYEIWPGKYQKQKVWQIDYYYNERGIDGVFALKHCACYFRQGRIVGNTNPSTVEEENARREDEENAVSRLTDGTWKDLSESTEAQIEAAASEDAQRVWYGLHLKRGTDGNFNWFEIGMNIADAEDTFHQRHALAKGPIQEAYDKKFHDVFTAIAHRIEKRDAGSY